MKCDVLVTGVEEQGARAMAALVAAGALRLGWAVRQAEVRGTPQRPGALQIHLRLSETPAAGERIPKGSADLILGLEPLETLRYLSWLTPEGAVISAGEPVQDISHYPDLQDLLQTLRARPASCVLDVARLARESGAHRALHVAVVGAAAGLLPMGPDVLEACVREAFRLEGSDAVEAALRLFRSGRDAAQSVTV
jgi:indolepyruvate ferredoxin oxidoreductase, beta subunit